MNAPAADRESTSAAVRGAGHPLDRLTAAEIDEARDILQADKLVTEHTRFAYLGLEEPPKDEETERGLATGFGADVKSPYVEDTEHVYSRTIRASVCVRYSRITD